MPLIAITACRKLEDYKQSVLHVGGDVRIVDATMTAEAALDGANGLMLTGGDDVEPSLYGEAPHAATVPAEAGRDEFELALVSAARRRRMPIFAICRGVQVLNVACGGTLVQDIPSGVGGSVKHSLPIPPNTPYTLAHEIWIERDTLLARLLGDRVTADSCEVNSRHHQAVKTVAPGFSVSATAPDGVLEAIEDPALPFCLGVQWHPENFWRTGEFRPLFEGFVNAAENPSSSTS
jgi:putative glutamine amidotransferase